MLLFWLSLEKADTAKSVTLDGMVALINALQLKNAWSLIFEMPSGTCTVTSFEQE